MQELSSNEDMTLEEKMKKRQEIQQQISDLNMQLRQHQIEQRKEKQQAKASSMDDMAGGTKATAGVLESEIKNNHGSDVTKKIDELADVTQKAQAATVSQMSILAEVASGKETSETVDSQKNSKVENGKMKSGTAAYAKELAKHAPSVEFRVGSALS